MNGYQFIPDLHEHNRQGNPDTMVDIEYETEEIITDMYNNRYPGIIPTDELGWDGDAQRSVESPPIRARRLRRYRDAVEGLEGNIPNYVLNNTLDVYIPSDTIPTSFLDLFRSFPLDNNIPSFLFLL